MRIQGEALLLRIFIGESDRWKGQPLYEAIVLKAREKGLAGATVLRGLEGFGASSRIHTTRILRLSEDLPIVVELVDREDRIRGILKDLDPMVSVGLITLEKVEVIVYRHDGERG
jgi:PII-like signaling protein